jgi:hypothetical protein
MYSQKLYAAALAFLFVAVACPSSAIDPEFDPSQVPGTVIAHSPKSSKKYIGSPGILALDENIYLAKYDEFGPSSTEHTSAVTHLYRSDDAGRHWRHAHTFQGLFWASIFKLNNDIYLLGTDRHHGQLVAFRSRDGGAVWSEPADSKTGLLRTGQNHTVPVPAIVYRGRVWRAFEDAAGGEKWGSRYRAMMMSAPVTADLLDADNWTFSNYLASDPKWLDGKFNGWLEGNAVVDPDGNVVIVLRVDYDPGEHAAIVHVSEDGRAVSFDPQKDFINFPGGATKFTIRRDSETGRYWTLSNPAHDVPPRTRAAMIRNTLSVATSPDLRTWKLGETLLHHPDQAKHAFQYVDWEFAGNDLIAVSRTAYDDAEGGAHRAHDANFLTFHRIPK